MLYEHIDQLQILRRRRPFKHLDTRIMCQLLQPNSSPQPHACHFFIVLKSYLEFLIILSTEMRELFGDGFNSLAHVMLGFLGAPWPLYVAYQVAQAGDNVIIDLSEYAIGALIARQMR